MRTFINGGIIGVRGVACLGARKELRRHFHQLASFPEASRPFYLKISCCQKSSANMTVDSVKQSIVDRINDKSTCISCAFEILLRNFSFNCQIELHFFSVLDINRLLFWSLLLLVLVRVHIFIFVLRNPYFGGKMESPMAEICVYSLNIKCTRIQILIRWLMTCREACCDII